jgi:hypothetical protein
MANQENISSTTPEVIAQYLKSNYSRVIHADGAWGGLTPYMNIYMALFSEHPPIPRSIKYKVEHSGTLSELSREAPPGITRDIEVEVVLSLEVARSLRNWLDDRLKQATSLQLKAESELKKEIGPDA